VNIDVVERVPARVAYLCYSGPFGEPLGRFWRATVAPWLADLGLIDCPRYGITLDDSRYEACVELPPGLALPDALQSTIAGGRYAIRNFKGNGATIGAGWEAFAADFAARGLARDPARHRFEHYPRGATCDPRTNIFACRLCIPVSS
jgi:AraC family transcriptional regulator